MKKELRNYVLFLCVCALVIASVLNYQNQVNNILTPTLRGEIGEQPSASFCKIAEAIGYPGFTAQDRWQCARVIHIVGSDETPPRGFKEGTK